MSGRKGFLIGQFSDVHCGDPRFDEKLMLRVVRELNAAEPDLVIVPGDLTQAGYAEQFEEFRRYLDLVDCPQRIVIAGNHDCRNVGYMLFEQVIGPRNLSTSYPFAVDGERGAIKVMAVDSNIPDLNDGEVGRDKLARLRREFSGDETFKVFVLHHHLVSIPGTGRERNVVWDAGDVLHALREHRVDLVLAGHKHVPYAWPAAEMLVVATGTAASYRTRGAVPPSFDLIRVTHKTIEVTVKDSASGAEVTEVFERRPAPPEVRTDRSR